MDARKQRETAFHDRRFGGDDNERKVTDKYYRVSAPGIRCYHDTVLHAARGARLLELGCGTGESALEWAQHGATVTGIDISPAGIARAQRLAARSHLSLRFEVMDAEALKFAPDSFDLVIGAGILHHLALPRAYAEVARVTAPAGRAIFLEPMGHNALINLYRRMTPALRTADEHPFLMSDLARAHRYFHRVNLRHFVILSLLATPLHRWPALMRPISALFERADRMLMWSVPFMQRYSWMVVMELAEPCSDVIAPSSPHDEPVAS